MKTLNYLIIALVALLVSSTSHAQRYSKTTYVHSDPDGTSFAATNSQGSEEWKIEHFPFGREYQNTSQDRKNDISFAGKPYDEEIGLSYFGGRWYDPDAGRFTSIDPMPVQFNDYESFNRYVYGFNNPYKYVDPDGNFPFLIPVAIFISKEIAAEGASRATGGATDFLSFRRLGTKALKKGALEFKSFNKVKDNGAPAAKRVGRHMSPDELAKMKKTGRVQEGGGGQTRVADPSDANTFRNAPDGDVFVEFDVPANRVLPHSTGTGRIPGPNSPDARVPGRNPADFEMPSATNIKVPKK